MPVVKKLGLTEGILPSLDELQTIRYIKMIVLKLISDGDVYDYGIPSSGWRTLRELWARVKYYRQSKTLSTVLNRVAKNCIFYHEPAAQRRASHPAGLDSYYEREIVTVWGSQFDSPQGLFATIQQALHFSDDEPMKLTLLATGNDWIFKGFHYSTEGVYSDEEFRLLIADEFDKERRHFERLKQKHNSPERRGTSRSRPSIPESVRIQVWRRDGAKCSRCGSREDLEYDHIIPLSRGGSNTARNIELLCEECNRRKSNSIG